MTPSVLVIGGAGYIGSHMCLALRERGWRVSVFDNCTRGWRDAIGDVTLVEGDLRQPDDLRRCLDGVRFDLVMHFAALAYVGESVSEPGLYYQNNLVGSLNLFEAMRATGHDRLVFSSTCATYGDPVERPITEAHPQRPVNPYGRTKLMVEQALADYAMAHGLHSVSLRYFNAAGCDMVGRAGERHEPETHLIPLVLEEALRLRRGGDPAATGLRIFGDDFDTDDGTCVRDYIHVQDLCQAHLLAGERLLDGRLRGAQAFNLGNGQGYSVLQVIDACRRITGQPIGYRIGPRRAGDPAWLVGSADRAREQLEWRPAIPAIDDIVASAWRWLLAFKEGSHA
jgi:UDP-glucose-4-epimerase GalE